MKRTIHHLPVQFLGCFTFAMLVWLMASPTTQAAPPLSLPSLIQEREQTHLNLPLALPRMATVTLSIDEPFPILPPTTTVTIDFNNASDVTKFQGISFDGRTGLPTISDYSHPTNSLDGDSELNLTVSEGKFDAVYDRHFIYFLKQPITDFIQMEVEILAAPTAKSQGTAGIELRTYGPTKVPTGNSTADANPKVYFALARDEATTSLGHRLWSGWRLNNASLLNAATTGAFRVHAPTAYKPVWLRITRDGNAYRFYYKDTAVSPNWKQVLDTIQNANTLTGTAVSYNVALGNPLYLSLFGMAENSPFISSPRASATPVFDNLSYVYTPTQQTTFPNWTTAVYGDATAIITAPNTNATGQLILQSNGKSVAGIDDNTTNSGYLLFSYKDSVASTTQFETLVQVKAAPTAEAAMGGLEVRSTLASNSPKLSYGLQREGSSYRLYAYSRDELGNVTLVMSNTVVNLTTPMWLKITRDPESNTFNFYQAQNSALPSSWTLYATTSLSLTSQIYSGLFNTSNTANTQQISQFDNFQMTGAETADDPITGLTIPNNTGVPNQNIPVNATVATGTGLDYTWSLGDGNTATGNPITLNYFNVGTYTLQVTATNNISTATASATVVINEMPISGLAAINNSPKIPRPEGTTPTTFTATVVAGSNVSYQWNFGDGRTGSGQVVSNLYQKAGNYTVLVTATNSLNVATASTIAVIGDNPIQGIGFNIVSNPAYEGTAIRLAAYPSPDVAPKATNVTYTWTLPGGVVTSTRVFYYDFPLAGSPHPVSVTACNSQGCTIANTSIIIEPVPDVKITGFTATVDAPTPVGQPTTFSAQVVSGTNVLYQWEFDDGTILTGQTVNRTLPIGTYKVTAIASNNQGFKEVDINFTVYGIPQITFTKSASEVVKVGEQVKYTLNITNNGTDDAFNVVVTDTVPAQATFVSNSGDVNIGIFDGSQVVWEIGTLAINQHATMYLTVDRPTSGLVTNSNYILTGLDRISKALIMQGPPVTTDVAYPPVAHAGTLQDVPPGSLVTLNGAGSSDPDKKPLTYFWQQISGSTVTLSGTNTMSPTFIAPARLGDLKFRLIVTNSSKLADEETVIVRVSYEPIFDITKSAPIEANYNDLITYTLTITNRGTAPASQVMITDIIPTGGHYVASSGGLDGGELVGNAVIWSVDSLPVKSHVVVTLAITATNNVINRDYSVSSAERATAKGKISLVTIVNLAPLVNAGRQQTMLPNILTTLDGRKTRDPGNLAMTYLWTQVDGPAVTLNNPTSLQPTFTTPSNFADLRFRLTATNSKNLSNFAEVTVKVAPWTTVIYQPIEVSCSDSEATVKAKEAVRVTNGNSSIYVGYQNANSSRDPITMKFTNGSLDWCRADYETTTRDGAGYGLLWDGNNVLYGVYTSDGNGSGNDFRRFSGWIESYVEGAAGGSIGLEIPVIAKIDPANGNISPTANDIDGRATFINALDFSYTVNKVVVNDLALDNNNLVVEATAWETPRQVNKLTLACNGKSPYAYSITFLPDLSQPVDASAVGCKEKVTPPGVVSIAGFTTGFIDRTYTFNTTVSPFYVTAPLTYTWFPEPLTGQGTTKVSYMWPQAGVQTLVLTVENRGGFLTQSHRITVTDPLAGVITLTEVSLTGPITGLINTAYTFSAAISPTFVAPPLVYDWSPAPITGQGTTEVSYSWPNSGTQTINLVVTNLRGAVSATQIITISEPPPVITAPNLVTISGPITGMVDTTYGFTATVSPIDVTLPLSYTWSPEPISGQGNSHVSYSWATSATQTINLTVSNQAGMATGSYTLETFLTPTLNLTPIAQDDFITTTSNTAVTIPVLANDSDPDADPLTIAAASPPQHGAVTVLNDSLIYTPTTDYVGGDTFTYTISDGRQGEATAQVTLLVFSATEQVIVTPIEVTKPTVITVPTPGGEVVIEVPKEITDENFILVYKALTQTSHVPPEGYGFGGQFFILQAYMDGQLQTRFTFTRPMTITLTYNDADVADLLEETLHIRYWHEISQTWEIDGLDNQPPDTTLNTVTAFINHLTEFALIGEIKPEPLKSIYLPIILRK